MLRCQKDKFNLPEGIDYIDCAYLSPLMSRVEKTGISAVQAKKSPHEIQPEDFFAPANRLRRKFSELIACDAPEQVVIIPSVSYGVASFTKNVRIDKGSNIVILGEQFPSNAYPWFRLAKENEASVNIVAAPETLVDRGEKWNQRLLEAINERTAIVALPHCHWADGTKFDLRAVREKTSQFNAAMLIDGTQSVGALPFDIKEIEPDALICAGYKWLLGPYSIGMAYYHPRFNEGIPLEESWINRLGSEDFSGLVDYQDDYQPGALRYEVGEHSNFILVPMLSESIEQILEWGVANIQDYCQTVSTDMISEVRRRGFWVEDEAYRGHHLFGIRIPEELDMERVKQQLEEKNVFVSVRGNSIRVSPHVYNTRDDLEKLGEILSERAFSEPSLKG